MTDAMVIELAITRAEVDAAVADIKQHAAYISARMAELFDRQAWRVEGYANWETFAADKFHMSGGWSRKVVNASHVAQNIGILPGENLFVKHAEQIAKLQAPEAQKFAYELAQNYVTTTGNRLTTAVIAQAVEVTREVVTTQGAVSASGDSLPASTRLGNGLMAVDAALVERIREERMKNLNDISRHSAPTLFTAKGRIQQAGDCRVLVWLSAADTEQLAALKRDGIEDVVIVVKGKPNNE